jgi:Tol biopolymer transport system component
MNVPNWSPDGKRLAFVSYQMLAPEDSGQSGSHP